MRKIWKRGFTVLASFVLAVFTAVVGVFPAAVSVRADTVNSVTAYESRNVLEDLENSTINGETFSLKKYGFNSKKETQVLTLAVILLCVLVFALLPILPTILDILALPFKAIGKWFGGGNKKE